MNLRQELRKIWAVNEAFHATARRAACQEFEEDETSFSEELETESDEPEDVDEEDRASLGPSSDLLP